MTPKQKAEELIEMHKCLSLGKAESYALVYCDYVIKGNNHLSDEKHKFWTDVIKEIEEKINKKESKTKQNEQISN